jgi:hypothetical protein
MRSGINLYTGYLHVSQFLAEIIEKCRKRASSIINSRTLVPVIPKSRTDGHHPVPNPEKSTGRDGTNGRENAVWYFILYATHEVDCSREKTLSLASDCDAVWGSALGA